MARIDLVREVKTTDYRSPRVASVACSTDTDCLGVTRLDQAFSWSHRVGNAWTPVQQVEAPGGIGNFTCAGPDLCLLPRGDGQLLRFDGSTWRNHAKLPGAAAVSCSSSRFCLARVGDRSFVYDGSGWTESATSPLGSFSCPTDGRCIAVDRAGVVRSYA